MRALERTLRLRFESAGGYWIPRTPPGPAPESATINSENDSASLVAELFRFVVVRKKYWLVPILVVMFLLGGLLVLAKGSAVAPFIYTLF
jgi:hypothetical protein